MIPGNDDSAKAVALYARGIADAILEGRANAVERSGQGGCRRGLRRIRGSPGLRRLNTGRAMRRKEAGPCEPLF